VLDPQSVVSPVQLTRHIDTTTAVCSRVYSAGVIWSILPQHWPYHRYDALRPTTDLTLLVVTSIYTPCPEKKRPPYFLALTLWSADQFSEFFCRQTAVNFLQNNSYIFHHTLECVATLSCEKFVLKNNLVPELSEVNCHAVINQLKGAENIFIQSC